MYNPTYCQQMTETASLFISLFTHDMMDKVVKLLLQHPHQMM